MSDTNTALKHGHGLDTIAGFVVKIVNIDTLESDDRDYFDGDAQYGVALERRQHLNRVTDWRFIARIVTVYTCGCRSDS